MPSPQRRYALPCSAGQSKIALFNFLKRDALFKAQQATSLPLYFLCLTFPRRFPQDVLFAFYGVECYNGRAKSPIEVPRFDGSIE